MSEIGELTSDDITYLQPYLPKDGALSAQHHGGVENGGSQGPSGLNARQKNDTLPFVTLTYASSLDGMISLAPGLRTTLSGPETKSMTHYLRLQHDAILVGVGATFETQPRPIVLDPLGRWDYARSKLAQLTTDGQGKVPWLIHVRSEVELEHAAADFCEHVYPAELSRTSSEDSSPAENRLSWRVILTELKRRGIESIMIEGGATIIASLLAQSELVDSVIVTLAPTWLGAGGVAVTPAARSDGSLRVNAARLDAASWRQFGADVVLCGRPR
ncbi:2,5-diamino-6-(ribosylamino)-4(3H)-pyrimidinone 5'-phosphate reductase [Recurvomyces mirabilis]|uniref:2,5-diamino-6-ribosylamino-4(3H)-pyrimidinone 5'-phosphate reductase n=1 Tax=Recurvomyces mirabilis TaxID=574656 RepID=A0AAE0WRK5_9PEZI|nr:2,5-diamino-6-(ribosylamino)-4(3H)-pyrimidinone 5'-phosphate reductase [Recurvomyces mirabilis]